jgi:hypothetical protein
MKLIEIIQIESFIILVQSSDQQNPNNRMNNTSDKVNKEQRPNIVQQIINAIKKAKD